MNKKVLTLCAGFLLAGGLNAFAVSSIVIPIGEKAKELKSDKAYFFVNDRSDMSGTLDFVYGHEDVEGQDGHIKELLYRGTGTINEEDIDKYLWYVEEIKVDGELGNKYGYKLTNKATGKQLIFNKDGSVDTNYTDNKDLPAQSGFFVFDGYRQFAKKQAGDKTYDGYQIYDGTKYTDATTQLVLATGPDRLIRWSDASSSTSSLDFYEYEDQEMGDNLNDLYNSIGFNFGIAGEEDGKVNNIFDQEGVRIRAIKLNNDVASNDPTEREFKFLKGTYFVTDYPSDIKSVDPSYADLMNCTFIAASPILNDNNDAAKRKTGEGFQLVTVSARDKEAFNNYTGTDKSRMSARNQVSVYNACFTAYADADGHIDLSLADFRFRPDATKTEQTSADGTIRFAVTDKAGDDHSEKYLTTIVSSTPNYYFVYKETNTVTATEFLNENAKKVYTFTFVAEDEDEGEEVDGKYLYAPAYQVNNDNVVYAKGAAFVDENLPEAQWIVTDVTVSDDAKNNTVEFTNRANNSIYFAAKMYKESDGSYTIGLDNTNSSFVKYTNLTVNAKGDIVKATNQPDLQASRFNLKEVSTDKFAGTWNVADETEVTMLFARDNTPTSNKLYVQRELNDDNKQTMDLSVSKDLSDAVQFQLIKSKDSLVITNPYAYKVGDEIAYATEGDTIAYYTYQLKAFQDGVAITDGTNEQYLHYESSAYKLAKDKDEFIIKENVDGSIALLPVTVKTDTKANIKTAYKHSQAVVLASWKNESNDLDDFSYDPDKTNHEKIKKDFLNQEVRAKYIKTYLNLEAPEVSLDTDKSYVQIKSEVGETYLAKNDENDAIMAAVAETPMTLRVFATDTKKEVPSFYIATDWNENGERMFMFNPVDSVDYYVAEGEFNKKYQWDEETNKVIFKQAYLDENLANLDTLVTEIKGEKATIAQEADNNKKVQAGLDKFKFQIVLAEDDDNLYWIRQNGKYLRSLNGKLTLSEGRTEALKVEIADTDMPTANESINAADEAVKVVATNGAVIVKGAEGKNVVVSTILGKVVANEVLNSDNETIAAPAGIVVVSVDGESFKVAVK